MTAKALPPARTKATVSAITSDVFMAKLALVPPGLPLARVSRRVDEHAMNNLASLVKRIAAMRIG
jgi:hypothetical protein